MPTFFWAGVAYAGRAAARCESRPRRRLVAAALAGALAGTAIGPAAAQVVSAEDAAAPIERIDVVLTNPSADAALNARVIDLIRKNLTLFPADRFLRATAEVGLARARRSGPPAATSVSVLPGSGGAVIVTVEATLREDGAAAAGGGALLTGPAGDLPVLYDRNGTFVTGKLETLTMLYANSDAWYGRPDLFPTGNPLVDGTPAGARTTGWDEAFVHAGIYGITPLGETTFAYGGLSGILSGSVGKELFTDTSRLHFGIEDTYVGIVGGNTSDEGTGWCGTSRPGANAMRSATDS